MHERRTEDPANSFRPLVRRKPLRNNAAHKERTAGPLHLGMLNWPNLEKLCRTRLSFTLHIYEPKKSLSAWRKRPRGLSRRAGLPVETNDIVTNWRFVSPV